MNKIIVRLMAIMYLTVLPVTGNATPIEVNLTFDVSKGVFFPRMPGDGIGHFTVDNLLDSPITLTQSNTLLDITVNFLPGQALRVFNTENESAHERVLIGFGYCLCSTGGNGFMEFIGIAGDLVANPTEAYTNTSNGFSALAGYVSGSPQLTNSYFDFSGIKLTNYQYQLNHTDSASFSNAWLTVLSDQVEVLSTVPTPATFALFCIGLAGLGWSRRKRA